MNRNVPSLPVYTSGDYFSVNMTKHKHDAPYKARAFIDLFAPEARSRNWSPSTYADVGCGSGDVTIRVAEGLRDAGVKLSTATGYDVSPGVSKLEPQANVNFVCGDFLSEATEYDLVTLFDVFEHVPAPIAFLQAVAAKCRWIGLHIPLDNSISNSLRDSYRAKLDHPGHLIFLDVPQALTLVALAGIRVINYRYTFNFEWPTGRQSRLARAAAFPRRLMSKINPWLTSRTLGGCSLMVVGETLSRLRYE